MKTLTLALMTLLLSTVHARSIHRFVNLEAELSDSFRWKLENFDDVETGTVSINYDGFSEKGTIVLKYTHAPDCGTRYCPEILYVKEVELPIVDIKRNSCGIVIYTAERNMMIVDGLDQALTVTDSSASTCPVIAIYPPLAATSIHYTEAWVNRLNGKLTEREAYLYADTLQ